MTITALEQPHIASEVAVRARAVARHYGAGETAVHALRGIDLDVETKHLTAIMGSACSSAHASSGCCGRSG
jgi:putative ABC transport system ATP-binding protein